jgi:hypothetical protein
MHTFGVGRRFRVGTTHTHLCDAQGQQVLSVVCNIAQGFRSDADSVPRDWAARAQQRTETSKEASLKHTIAPTMLAIVVATMFVPGIVRTAQAGDRDECSNATLHGSFGFTSIGTLLNLPPPLAGPFAEIGRQTFDGRGMTDATATASANGNINKLTLQGTYSVDADCTGSMTLAIVAPFIGAPFKADFVIDDNATELRVIVYTAPGSIESRTYKKQFTRGRSEQ